MGRNMVRFFLGILAFLAIQPAHAAPKVVASIVPLQSIVAGVMAGVGTPETLVRGGASPHGYALRPSDARMLEAADLVVWIGPNFENFLARPLASLGGRANTLALADIAGVTKLETREGGTWEEDADEHDHGHPQGDAAIDGHMFLDPANMKLLASATAEALAKLDPTNAIRYRSNAEVTRAHLDALDRELEAKLRSLAGRPYIVFHDAYRYFENRYGLAGAGSVTVDPERKPGARRIQQIRDRVRKAEATCVFAEPQFEPALVRTIVRGTDARTGTLDPVGVGVKPGPVAYATIMRALADAFSKCLSP
ncbi:MAG: zinc ABC transporter substrate-binding protein [Alphaproteobacteria bacterium]|nr:zinc ABC transporter substrate-binding protein [Alphaproteobacteria bacterium]